KGLNPNAPMKDSGVEWLGEVPAHWRVARLKQVSSFITSGPRGWSDYIADEGDDAFLQSGDLDDEMNVKCSSAKRISPPKGAEGVRTKAQKGDVLVCITGANTGRVGVIDYLSRDTYINQHLALVRLKKRFINSDFLAFSLSGNQGKTYFSVAQYGLKEGLSLTNVENVPVCIPPVSEQEKIIESLWLELKKISELFEISKKTTRFLSERRSALISAAVTGKIDVRGWQPSESTSPEPILQAAEEAATYG
ncbi:restriction endonuclease subunit S, partial [Pseudoalteromonas sp. GABNS16A]